MARPRKTTPPPAIVEEPAPEPASSSGDTGLRVPGDDGRAPDPLPGEGSDGHTEYQGEPEPEPVGPFTFTETFLESTRGYARDRWRQRCLAQVRTGGHKPLRIIETPDPPLGTASTDGMRVWTLTVEIA